MFTWVCPSCGKELDLATKQCPNCPGQAGQQPAATGGGSSSTRFWVLLGAGALAGILALVLLSHYLSHRPARAPEEKSPQVTSQPAPAAPPRPIEIAGIRTFYDERNTPQVRAVIINHGEEGIVNRFLTVALRPASSSAQSPPLARFTIKIAREIKPGDSQEIKAPLEAFGTLASLPPWDRLRADLE